MIREIDGGSSSHLSQNSVIAHFGLGNASTIDKITVYWTGGNKQTITNVKANQQITITEIPAPKSSSSLWYFIAGFTVVSALIFVYARKRKKP